MKRLLVVLCLVAGSAFAGIASGAPSVEGQGADKPKKAEKPKKTPAKLTDNQVKDRVIAESKANYQGNCPCDEDTDAAGHRCGRRSAHSREGGAEPICYRSEVTADMVTDYRNAHPEQTAEAEKTAN
jgi:hypothetical protein